MGHICSYSILAPSHENFTQTYTPICSIHQILDMLQFVLLQSADLLPTCSCTKCQATHVLSVEPTPIISRSDNYHCHLIKIVKLLSLLASHPNFPVPMYLIFDSGLHTWLSHRLHELMFANQCWLIIPKILNTNPYWCRTYQSPQFKISV